MGGEYSTHEEGEKFTKYFHRKREDNIKINVREGGF